MIWAVKRHIIQLRIMYIMLNKIYKWIIKAVSANFKTCALLLQEVFQQENLLRFLPQVSVHGDENMSCA